jgi:hypothetical protein
LISLFDSSASLFLIVGCEDLVASNPVLAFSLIGLSGSGCAQLQLVKELDLHLSIGIHTLGAVENAVTGD